MYTKTIIFTLLLTLTPSILAGTVSNSSSSDNQINCWKDDKGKLVCGDFIPADEAKKEILHYNEQGEITSIKQREMTPEEYAAAQEELKKKKELAEQEERQKKYDHFLITSYKNSAQLEKERAIEEGIYNNRIQLLSATIDKNQKDLDKYNQALKEDQSKNKPIDKNLLSVRDATEKNLAVSQSSLLSLQNQKQDALYKIDSDINRLNYLLSQINQQKNSDTP